MSGPPQSQPPRWLPHQNQPHPAEAAPPALILTNRHPAADGPSGAPDAGLTAAPAEAATAVRGTSDPNGGNGPTGPAGTPPTPTRRA